MDVSNGFTAHKKSGPGNRAAFFVSQIQTSRWTQVCSVRHLNLQIQMADNLSREYF